MDSIVDTTVTVTVKEKTFSCESVYLNALNQCQLNAWAICGFDTFNLEQQLS